MKSPFRKHLLLFILTLAPTISTVADDIRPNTANGTVVPFGAETARLEIGLAGDASSLYLVSLNAGVWKSVADGAWKQLRN